MRGLEQLQATWMAHFGRPTPEKIICVGLNYHDHAREQGAEPPAEPLLFAKLANSLCGPGDPIVLAPGHVDGEAELAITIGKAARFVRREDVLEHVAGYTAANDVSARDYQSRDGQWLRAKSFDTFCPVLPAVVPVSEVGDASNLPIRQRVNGDVLQDSSTSSLIFGVEDIVAHCSRIFSLVPGDLILTGTPAGVGVFRDPPVSLAPGDVVEIEIEGIGALRNPVTEGPAP